MTTEVDELSKHIEAVTAKLTADIQANKPSVAKKLAENNTGGYRVGILDAPPAGTLASGAAEVGTKVGSAVGGLIGGTASTVADAVGGVGNLAEDVRNEINTFFGNLRHRLGI